LVLAKEEPRHQKATEHKKQIDTDPTTALDKRGRRVQRRTDLGGAGCEVSPDYEQDCNAAEKIELEDPHRRSSAAQLAYA
jgi:hypothetical protein